MKHFKFENNFFFFSSLLLLSLLFIFFVNREIHSLYLISNSFEIEIKKEKPITLIFVGDIMIDRGVKGVVEKYGNKDYTFPFQKIEPQLKEADVLVGNLEGPISDKGKKVGSIYSFLMDPKAIEGLKFAGFDILSLANNHIFDYGREAMEDTFLRLQDAGIDYVGGGFNEIEACSPRIKEIKNTKIAFLAFSNVGSSFWQAKSDVSGICWLNKQNLEKRIKEAKSKADLVIVLFHFGNEYEKKANFEQKDVAHFAIDLGGDLVVGHHPHVIQEIEEYKGKYIAYSLGNFIFDQYFSKETMEGLILKVKLQNKKIKEVIPIKFKINQYFQPEISSILEKEIPQSQKEEKLAFNVKPIFTHLPGQIVKCVYRISGIPFPKEQHFLQTGKKFGLLL
jgi:poly-gamma-glutamate capsule biosynthesis protein CapA/YwtB (metallophosphatase superfamily)